MFQKFQNYFNDLTPSEKHHYDNGVYVELYAGHDMVKTIWNYGVFYPKDKKSIKIFRGHPTLTPAILPAVEVGLTEINDNFPVAEELSKLLDIEDSMFKPLRTFSGGMKRKLEIVRSLIHKPKVLFLDEPTTGLDPLSRRSLWKYLQRVRKEEKTTIFLTTHYLEEAEVADHVGIVNDGKIVMYGTPKDIKNQLVHNELIVDADNREKLRSELLNFTKDIQGTGPFRIPLGTVEHTQKIIKSLATPLTLLDINRPTLEDAYLAIVDHGGTEADGTDGSVIAHG